MTHYVRMSPQAVTAVDELKVGLDAPTKSIVPKGEHALVLPQPLYQVPQKRNVLGRVEKSQPPSPSVVFSACWPPSVEDPAVIAAVRQQIVPPICARNNVVLLFHGHTKSGKTCLFEILLPVIIEALKSTVGSAEEAAQESLALTGVDGITARLHRAVASPVPGHPSIGKSTATSSSVAQQQAQKFDAGDSQSAPADRRQSVAARRPSASSPNSANNNSALPGSKFSLLLARLPRGEGIVDMASVDLLAPAARSPHRLLPSLRSDGARTVSPGGTSRDASATGSSPPLNPANKWRLFTERARSPVQLPTGGLTNLGKKNGVTCGEQQFLTFDGTNFLENPSCTVIDKIMKNSDALEISFWICSAMPEVLDASASTAAGSWAPVRQQCVFHVCDVHDSNFKFSLLANTNDVGTVEANQCLVTVRDGHGKKMEVSFSTTALSDGHWHFLQLVVYKRDAKIEMNVDDRPCRSKVGSHDPISAFNDNRNRHFTIGSELVVSPDTSRKNVNNFAGSIFDLVIAEANGGKRFSYFPFRSQQEQYDDVLLAGGSFQTGVNAASPPSFIAGNFIATSPTFDGYDTYVNMGALADLGLIQNVQLEITFRTSCTTERMCLLGVQDTVGKQPGFGVELNVNSQQQLQRYTLMFWVQDRGGNCVRCISEISDAFDDRWHTLTIRVIDAAANRFKIKLDGRQIDYAVFTNGAPLKEFMCYVQYVTLGCCNLRGNHKRFFRGSVKKLKIGRIIDDVENLIGEWLLNEGPGALLAMDNTGHGLNGVYFLKQGQRGSRFLPSDEAHDGQADDLVLTSTLEGTVVQRYLNNQITAAVVSVDISIDPAKGCVREELRDYIHNRTYPFLEPVDLASFNSRVPRDDHRDMLTIPEECFKRLVPADYVATVRSALQKAEKRDIKRSHLIVCFRIGDAMFTAIDPASYSRTHRAVFVPSQLQWSDATSIFGPENKMNFFINTCLGKADKILATVGSRPQLYKRSLFQRSSTSGQSDNMLCNILLFALVAAKERSALFMMHLLSPKASLSEAQHCLSLMCTMRDADLLHAAIVVQKLFRWKKAYKRFTQLLKVKLAAEARKDKMAQMKRQFPKDCVEKEKRLALIVMCMEFEYDPAMPKVAQKYDDVQTVPRLLEANGYQCELMLNPSRSNLLAGFQRKKADQARLDASLLVYFVGLSARDTYHPSPALAVMQSWLSEEEREARLRILLAGRKELTDVLLDEREDYNYVDDKLKAAAEEAAKKAAKKKKGKGAAPDPAIAALEKWPAKPRMYTRDELLKMMAAWDERLAPPITPVVDAGSDDLWSNHQSKSVFFCVGDTRAVTTRDNIVTLAEMKQALMADEPKRGEHVVFVYDTLPLESSTSTSNGLAGILASSGESISIEYKKNQSLLFGYYFKRILQGCAVEVARIGKNEPPTKTSVELATRYLLRKLDASHQGTFPAAHVAVNWFGEFVGDVFICPKLVSKKEDRRKAKTQAQGKKGLAKISFAMTGPIATDYRQAIQGKIAKLLQVPSIDLRRPSYDDWFDLYIPADFNTLTSHEIAKRALTEDLSNICRTPIPAADASLSSGLKWFCKKSTGGFVAVEVRPIPQPKASHGNVDMDGGAKDQKQMARELVEANEVRDAMVEERVVRVVNTLQASKTLLAGTYPVQRAVVHMSASLNLTEEECLKLERMSRAGLEFLPNIALRAVRILSEKECGEIEQVERMIAIEEARRQAEAKQRLVAEAEARKKAEEEMARLQQKKEAVTQRVMQLKSTGTFSQQDVEYCTSVPLPDAVAPLFEALSILASKTNFPPVKGTVVSRLASLPNTILQDPRLLAALWRFTGTIITATEDYEAAGKVLSLILPSTLSQPMPLATAVGRYVVPALAAVAQVPAGRIVLDQGLVPQLAPKWAQLRCDGLEESHRVLLAQISPSIADMLSEPMLALYPRKRLFSHIATVLCVAGGSSSVTSDDIELVLQSLASQQDLSYAEQEGVEAFVAVFSACKTIPATIAADAGLQAAVGKLSDPMTAWSSDSAKLFLATVEQCDLSERQLAVLQPLVTKATAAAPPQ